MQKKNSGSRLLLNYWVTDKKDGSQRKKLELKIWELEAKGYRHRGTWSKGVGRGGGARNLRIYVGATGSWQSSVHGYLATMTRIADTFLFLKMTNSVLFGCKCCRSLSRFPEHEAVRIIATPPRWDAIPISGNPPEFCQVSLTVFWYPFILLGGESHCESKVFCPRTQHNDPANARTRTSRSGV